MALLNMEETQKQAGPLLERGWSFYLSGRDAEAGTFTGLSLT